MAKNFAVIGVGGYIAPRHLKAIRDTGNRVVAAVDPKDSVGILDQFAFDTHFFTEIERFDRHLEKLRRGALEQRVDYVTVCSPNYLHDSHCRMGLRIGAHVICEKPLVISPWNLDYLEEIEKETGKKVYSVLQLRVHPKLIELREEIRKQKEKIHDVVLTYVTGRGNWYHRSWKGSPEHSGGIATNIGIHFLDFLLWVFGEAKDYTVHYSDNHRMSGNISLKRARVKWFLSVDPEDLPFLAAPGGKSTFRSITVDGKEIEFTEGFTDLHTLVYEKILAGEGHGIEEARPAVSLAHDLRTGAVSPPDAFMHPFIEKILKVGGPRKVSKLWREAYE